MEALWWMFGLLMVALIIHVRFYRSDDEYCEFCHTGIDLVRDSYIVSPYVIELGITRIEDEWYFCNEICQAIHYANLKGNDNV